MIPAQFCCFLEQFVSPQNPNNWSEITPREEFVLVLAAGWTSWHSEKEVSPGAERLIQPNRSNRWAMRVKNGGPEVENNLWLAGSGRSVVLLSRITSWRHKNNTIIKFFLVVADPDSSNLNIFSFKVGGCFHPSSQNLNNRNRFNWTEKVGIFSEENFYFGSWNDPTECLNFIICLHEAVYLKPERCVWTGPAAVAVGTSSSWSCWRSTSVKDFLLESLFDGDRRSRQ